MRKIDGVEYLYQRGSTYVVRVQVPSEVQATLGRTELKKSLGGDFNVAKRKAHSWKAQFLSEIEAARNKASVSGSSNAVPDRHAIDSMVWQRFQIIEKNLRGRSPLGGDDKSRKGRLREVEQWLEMLLDADERRSYAIVAQDARWLAEEHGWKLDEAGTAFAYLCEGYARARIEFLRRERAILAGDRSDRADADPMFGKSPPKVPPSEPQNLGSLIEAYKRAQSANWSKSTEKNYTIIFRVLEEIGGKDKPLAEIDRAFCEGIRDTLKQLPSNYQKRPATRGKAIAEVVEISEKLGLPRLMPQTINSHLAKLAAILRYGNEKGWVPGFPASKLHVRDDVDPSDKRDPFSIDQLQKIFTSSVWSPGMVERTARPQRFWVPLMALFTGARIGEIVALRPQDFEMKQGILVIKIANDPAHRKTKGRRSRVIPVHSELVRMGLDDYVSARREAKAQLLFEGEKANSLAQWGDSLSDWFARTLTKLEMPSPKLTFHSFRHSFEDALRVRTH